MGYMTALGACYGCGRMFAFNPEQVPSYKGEPVCQSCITLVNERRKASGLPEWPVLRGAYEPEEVS